MPLPLWTTRLCLAPKFLPEIWQESGKSGPFCQRISYTYRPPLVELSGKTYDSGKLLLSLARKLLDYADTNGSIREVTTFQTVHAGRHAHRAYYHTLLSI